ncbi:MAG: 3-keto-disaccharide hydrolase, partial [Roseimicrobium sp.]
MNSRRRTIVLASLCSLLLVPLCQAQEISLFNGRDLTGWRGLPQYWSVKDGAITGKVTAENGSKGNTFLVWQGGEVADFELTLQYRLTADNPERLCDSGIQFRSQLGDASRFGLKGYQANLDPGTSPSGEVWKHAGGFNGCLMDDPPGLVLAYPGQKTVVHPETPGMPRKNGPQPNVEQVGSLGADITYRKLQRANEWNECRSLR